MRIRTVYGQLSNGFKIRFSLTAHKTAPFKGRERERGKVRGKFINLRERERDREIGNRYRIEKIEFIE